ncbi:hypothetical protein ABT095_04845 [Kitasatospora sp. NPDC002227]|uniref:hypothetical protein n=1 Tax=Kitasatospora sp. NPDC002227 TaxID=3154773 RepID=UPI0033274775
MASTSRRLLLAALSAALLALTPGVASAATLDGSFTSKVQKPNYTTTACADGDECGVIQLTGYGPAAFAYRYGPTFEPDGTKGCYTVDGTLLLTLQSDGSTLSGPLTGVFCHPGGSEAQRGNPSYGHPFHEDDTVTFTRGTGQFTGLHGTAAFHTFSAGAVFNGTLTGTLSS